MSEIDTKKLDRLMWASLFTLVVLPWVLFFLRPQPSDVLQEVKDFRHELADSRKEIEGELLKRTRDRIYRSEVEELIRINNLQMPPAWDK